MEASNTSLLQKKPEESQHACSLLQARVLELGQNLEGARDFIFSLQPRQQVLTETEASNDYKSLCVSIEEFVDRKFGDALYNKMLQQVEVGVGQAKKLLDWILPQGKKAFRHPNTDVYNITAAILRFLVQNVFLRNYYLYVENIEAAELMRSVEEGLRTDKRLGLFTVVVKLACLLEELLYFQRKETDAGFSPDLITCRTWRCSTYGAIMNRREFPQVFQRRKEDLASGIATMLEILLPPNASRREFTDALLRSIIEPACALAQKMHLSVDEFSFTPTPNDGSQPDWLESVANWLDCLDLVDFETRRKMVQPLGGLEFVLEITPELVLRRAKAKEWAERKILCKSRVLVAMQDKNHPRPSKSQESQATVLGWLNGIQAGWLQRQALERGRETGSTSRWGSGR